MILTVITYLTIFSLVLGGAYYLNLLQGIAGAVFSINNDFWSFIPVELRIFFGLIVFSLIVALAFSFRHK